MRHVILAVVILAGACASEGPSTSGAGQAASASAPTYEDARSVASDDAIRVSRRAYRAACQSDGSSADYCECMTASMAQTLAPADLDIATAELRGETVAGAARTAPARAQAEAACRQYLRN